MVEAAAAAQGATANWLQPMLARAATADDRATAYFIRERMELTAAQRGASGPFMSQAILGDQRACASPRSAPPARRTSRRLSGRQPSSWTPQTRHELRGELAAEAARRTPARMAHGPSPSPETATPLARQPRCSRLDRAGRTTGPGDPWRAPALRSEPGREFRHHHDDRHLHQALEGDDIEEIAHQAGRSLRHPAEACAI